MIAGDRSEGDADLNGIAGTHQESLVVVPHMDANAVFVFIPHLSDCAGSNSRTLTIAESWSRILRIRGFSRRRQMVTSFAEGRRVRFSLYF